jgi:hypothetical protein
MTPPALSDLRLLAAGLLVCGAAGADGAAAETVVYRFEAEHAHTPVAPPEGSATAQAAALPRLSGTFGFETGAPVAAGAGIPGRVAFAGYDTGFIRLDAMDTGRFAGEVGIRVTDGVTQADDPRTTIVDELLLGTRAVSADSPVDALSLRVRYLDAERLQGVGLPGALALDDISKMTLTFSTRIDILNDRADGRPATEAPAGGLLGLVHFDITEIERVE